MKDYSLQGEETEVALATGLANPKWYRTKVEPADIRLLMEKDDAQPNRDAIMWLGGMVLFGIVGVMLWPSPWSIPIWLAYGVLYGSASDAWWHECGHKTAFKTTWKNEVCYHIACFMLLRSPVVWRASHVRHHTDTIIVGRDPEIVAMRPPDLMKMVLNLFALIELQKFGGRMIRHAMGSIDPEEAPYLREMDYPKVYSAARVHLSIHLAVWLLCLVLGTILPLVLIGLPTLYGAWHRVICAYLQHLGLAENVTDHRLNTRTVLMNPVSRFIYLNMNYHLEHHMFTMVPYYNLPKLHELIKHDTPKPDQSIAAAFKRLLPVLKRQLQYHDAVIIRDLPESAEPYRTEVEKLRPFAA